MSLLTPTSIAVIGASMDPSKVGHSVLQNIITQGFRGEIYPVNPKGGEIEGKKAYASVSDIPGSLDMAVIVTPVSTVLGLAEECGKKGVKTLIVISAGFGETGTDEGHKNEAALKKIAETYKMFLIGPNCLGIIRPSIGLNASFAANLQNTGSIALLSQSGALAVALMDMAPALHLGFSLMVSMGNKAATDECDFLEICRSDPETKVVGIYAESIRDGQKFLQIASEMSAEKHIVLLKAGVSDQGQRAAASHTGALAGSDSAIDAVCRQAGVHRAHSTEEFLDLLRVLSSEPPLLSRNIAVITNAGGPGILSADAASLEKLLLPALSPKNAEALGKALPPAASVKNPIDVLGDADASRYAVALTHAAMDPGIDGIVVLLTPQTMTPVTEIAHVIVKEARENPLMPVITSFIGGESVKDGIRILHEHGIPNFTTPEAALHAMAALLPKKIADRSMQKAITPSSALDGFSGLLPEDATADLLQKYKLPIPAQALAHSIDDLASIIKQLRFPLIAKVSSPDILHKTDMGGVRADLRSLEQMQSAYEEIMANAAKNAPTATIRGVLFQELLPPGDEFIVGAVRQGSFGHQILVGLGGIYTELFADTSSRIAPVSAKDAYEMLQDIKGWKLLLGMRGRQMSDIHGLAELISRVSQLVSENPRIRELDLNPVIVRSEGVTVVDAKIVLEEKPKANN